MPSNAAYQAAAVRNGDELSTHSVLGAFHGRCEDCRATFDFQYGGDQHMAPCPECGSNEWVREDDELSETDLRSVDTDTDQGGESGV